MPTTAEISPLSSNAFLFMKVGNHAGETFDDIIARKMKEREAAGKMFWGYGGSACHPLTQVRPFVDILRRSGQVTTLVMQYISSNMDQDLHPATEFSKDGVNWEKIPDGICVTGSKYAMVLDEIKPGEFIFEPSNFEIGVGPSRGKSADKYLQGRTDKACLMRREGFDVDRVATPESAKIVTHQAKLLDPYAVMLR